MQPEQWREWSALNRRLLTQWRELLEENPALAVAPKPTENAELYTLFNLLSDDILAVFETGKGCVALSSNWERLTGHALAESRRDGFYDCLEAAHVKPFLSMLQQAICEGEQHAMLPHRFRVVRRDGVARWFFLDTGPVQALPDGRCRIACRLRDAHEQFEAQQKIEQARRDMEMALQSRSEFLNAMSHELRTPLNAILGFSQIMENGIYGEIGNTQYRDYLRHIRESGEALLAQIDSVLEMARLDAAESLSGQEALATPEPARRPARKMREAAA